MIKALVFDFDGLILDTESTLFGSWLEVFREHGQVLPMEHFTAVVGSADHFDPGLHLEELLGTPLEQTELSERIHRRYLELVGAEQILPGVRERLAEAREMGLKLGVASSSRRDWVEGHLRRLGLDGWDCLRCRGEAPRAKPHPDLYLAVVECLGVEPGEALALEDSANGIRAAKSAGLFCVAIPNPITAGLDLSLADLRLDSLADATLEELLARLAAPPVPSPRPGEGSG